MYVTLTHCRSARFSYPCFVYPDTLHTDLANKERAFARVSEQFDAQRAQRSAETNELKQKVNNLEDLCFLDVRLFIVKFCHV